jgi:hypothetical protein
VSEGDNDLTGSKFREPPKVNLADSLFFGLELLEAAKVRGALCGTIAAWQYLPEEEHEFTKDVDFAVSYGRDMDVFLQAKESGCVIRELDIGGYQVKCPGVLVDFVSRKVYHAKLFAEAVSEAWRTKNFVFIGDKKVHVVPKEYLVAMKLLTFREKDDRTCQRLIAKASEGEVREMRLVVERLLPALVEKLENLIRSVGHPLARRLGEHRG